MATTGISTSPHKILVERQCLIGSARGHLNPPGGSNENVSSNIERTKCSLKLKLNSNNTDLVDITPLQSCSRHFPHLTEVAHLLLATQCMLHQKQVSCNIRTLDRSNSLNMKQSFEDETTNASVRDESGWKQKLETED